ncbi:MAG: class I fructose-bisphosphate aldolase family protein [Deltaproteobacteria bacterium]|nr:class I fructose-bisphosphate aldolase family protein [Deltaproteobacteria bacterium]MBW2084579.1 class I fructose-bisphosphate aldolase family protein [Deltaproteobacteria bacterium]
MIGKDIRMERIMNRATRKTVIVPMDHGVSMGPVSGLTDMRQAINEAAVGGANAVVMHKGLVRSGHRSGGKDLGLIVHLSGSTVLSPEPYAKTLVCTVEEAIKLGADAVSVHINLGNDAEKEMLNDLSNVARISNEWGMPLLAMIYPRGERIKDEYDPEAIKHAARIGAELGADLVKVSYTGDPETFAKVVEGCGVPVVIAGGPRMDSERDVLEMVHGAMSAGACGLSIGRNVFQHPSPSTMVRTMALMVHEGTGVEEALKMLADSQVKIA